MSDYELKVLNTLIYKSEEIMNAIQKLKSGTVNKGQVAPNSWVIEDHYEVKPNMSGGAKVKSWAKAKLHLIKVENGSITFKSTMNKNLQNAGFAVATFLVSKVPFIGTPLKKLTKNVKSWGDGKFIESEWGQYKKIVVGGPSSNQSELALASTYITCHSSKHLMDTVNRMSANLNMLIGEQAGLYEVTKAVLGEALLKDEDIRRSAYSDVVSCGQREYVLMNDIRTDYDTVLTFAATLKDIIDICTTQCNENQDFLKAHETHQKLNS